MSYIPFVIINQNRLRSKTVSSGWGNFFIYKLIKEVNGKVGALYHLGKYLQLVPMSRQSQQKSLLNIGNLVHFQSQDNPEVYITTMHTMDLIWWPGPEVKNIFHAQFN